jgi:hypothetical protein
MEEIAAVQEKLKSNFVLTDQGDFEYYLGVEVLLQRSQGSLYISA